MIAARPYIKIDSLDDSRRMIVLLGNAGVKVNNYAGQGVWFLSTQGDVRRALQKRSIWPQAAYPLVPTNSIAQFVASCRIWAAVPRPAIR
jgi:hypothetical protein